MADLIDGGDVRVNWKDITQASSQVKSGDLILNSNGCILLREMKVRAR